MDFKRLKSDVKLEYILKFQSEGLCPKDIASKMGYSQLKNLNDFMRKQGYLKNGDIYIQKVENTCSINDIQVNTSTIELFQKASEDNYITNIGQSKDEQEKLNNILNNHTEIFEMLDWFRKVKAKYPTADIPLGFNIDYNKSNIIKTTVRVDETIWEIFSDICKSKYSHLSKVDILSQILKNFIDEND